MHESQSRRKREQAIEAEREASQRRTTDQSAGQRKRIVFDENRHPKIKTKNPGIDGVYGPDKPAMRLAPAVAAPGER